MNQIWITSDTHFSHNKAFLYQPRGFNSIEEHDNTIIEKWNSVVQLNDIVYHLGDIMLLDNVQGLKSLAALHGTIKIIRGNHCTDNRIALYKTLSNVEVLGWADMLKSGKWKFYLSHYPTLIGNFDESDPKFWNLCGHSHCQDRWQDVDKGQIYHVELDAHNNYPVNLEEIKQDIIQYRQNYNGLH